ncbi:MAG TPA: copper-binding protein [Opitutaceae bacterium]|nr:copper-binding protein [Opitutaceae bacterium]
MLAKFRLGLCLLAPVAVGFTAEEKNPPKPDATPAPPVRRFPLRGVVTTVIADQSSLMVKHEAIPGVMRAMTMMFKVEADTLKAVHPGDAITAQLTREGDDWWLRQVKVTEPARR